MGSMVMKDFYLYYITGEKPVYFACWRCWSHDYAFYRQRAKLEVRREYLGQKYVLIFTHVKQVSEETLTDILSQLAQREAENEKAQY